MPSHQDFLTSDHLAYELGRLGVPFVRSETGAALPTSIPPAQLLAALAASDEARLRLALIPLFLMHPDYAAHAPEVAVQLAPVPRLLFRCYYTAAMLLQQIHAERLHSIVGPLVALPDLFSSELGLPQVGRPLDRLQLLAVRHASLSGYPINWLGTYQHAAERLLTHMEKAAQWTG